MPTAIYIADNLPRFLLGDSIQSNPDQLYLIRCHAPRFIAPVKENPDNSCDIQEFEWIDPPPNDPMEAARLMREAGDWVAEELRLQELEDEM